MHVHWPAGGSLVQLESASTLSFCGEGRLFGFTPCLVVVLRAYMIQMEFFLFLIAGRFGAVIRLGLA